jgi:hypothetical protein
MPVFKLPLSGDVVQSINPWTVFFQPQGGQWGLININLGQSSAPDVESEVLTDVGTYGKQLGKVGDALLVLMDHFRPARALSTKEGEALSELREMLVNIDAIKRRHNRPTTPARKPKRNPAAAPSRP